MTQPIVWTCSQCTSTDITFTLMSETVVAPYCMDCFQHIKDLWALERLVNE